MKLIGTLIIVFLVLGALFIISNGNLHLSDDAELMSFFRIYYAWVLGLFENIPSINGDVIRSFIPEVNSSIGK